MSKIKHTPTPWKVVSEPHFDNGLVYTSIQPVNIDEETMKPLAMANGEYHVCRMSHSAAPWRFDHHRADAAFIVTAVNSFASLQEENEALKARIAELEAENNDLKDQLGDPEGVIAHSDAIIAMSGKVELENEALKARVAALTAALKFYADAWCFTTSKSWSGLEWKPKESLLDDCGNIARAALANKTAEADNGRRN